MSQDQSDERYRALFSSIDEGFCVVEVLFDDAGRPADYRFLEVNPAFQRESGLVGAAGRRMRELAPGHEQHWFDIYGRVALTGQPARFENEAKALGGRWFDVNAFRLGPPERRQVGVLFTDVTERKRAEAERDRLHAALEAERARLAAVVEQAPAFMAVLRGPDHVFELVNERYYQLVGHRDIVGKSVREALPEVEGQGLFELLDRVYATGESFAGRGVPVRVRRQPGQPLEERFVEFVYQPVRAGDGAVTGVLVHGVDLTDRRRAEDALRESERQYRLMVENVRDYAVFMADADGRVAKWNAGAERLLGWREDEIVGQPGAVVFTPEDRRRGEAEKELETARRTGHAADERWHLRKDGSRFFASGMMMRVDDADGRPVGFTKVLRDETERRRADDALRESERRFRQLADAMPQMVWVTRADGYHEHYNRRWYEFTGAAEGSTDGEGWSEMFHPDDRARAWAAWRHSLATGEPYEVEYRLRHHTGQYRWTLGRALPIRDDRGAVERWFGTCTDIDALKRLQHERETLLERELGAGAEAEAANRAKDRFLAVLSHELRTPLTPVAMAATAMEMDPALPYEFREDVAMIRRNVELETRLIDDLLDLSRVTTGKLRLNRQPTHVHAVVRHVLETVGPELHEKQLGVETACAARHDLVDADPARLQQVLWNLLKNAGKFTAAGGRVSVRTRNDEPGRVVVEVADTGRGIAADVLSRIFDPFEQGTDEVTRRYGGMGLGLAIAKAVVDLHGGTIRATSAGEGKGAAFAVALPLHAVAPADATPRGEEPAAPARPLRLLLVEDHADTAKTLARLLRLDGLDVRCAHTVAGAVELAGSEPFDVVVSDLGLPDGSGHDLMRRLRRDRAVPGIAMSGYGMEDDLRQSRDAGFAEHLVKPVNLPQLREAIRRAAGDASR
jgi:PAS domain S-box-containing protein